MSLEFNRVVEQIYRMGSMLDKLDFDLSESLASAKEHFAAASDLDAAWERRDWVRQPEISGYRGALPLDAEMGAEVINAAFPEPELPPKATIIAADGGQVYPDELAPVHYYLLNIGLYLFPHGQETVPEQVTHPELKFHKADVHDRYGRVIRNSTVDDRRTVEEMKHLAAKCWEEARKGAEKPIVALYDNRLLYLPGDNMRRDEDLLGDYLKAMRHLYDSGATLAGYVDNSFRSRRVIQLLYLLSIETFDELRTKQAQLSSAGNMEGLRDVQLFSAVLKRGERSAIMVQNSPQNLTFREKQGENMEIAFFYLKVANTIAGKTASKIVRVDIPMWVARDKQRVDALHALLLHQCRLQGRNPYPYALTRADELAWIGGKDRAKLEELVNAQIRRSDENAVGRTLSAKARGKDLARSEKRYHNMWGEIEIDDAR